MMIYNVNKAIKKIVSNDVPDVHKRIVIEYQEDDDNWIRYSMFYTRDGEIDVDEYNIKTMKSLEEVKQEMMAINEEYGEFDYLRVNDDREFQNVTIS